MSMVIERVFVSSRIGGRDEADRLGEIDVMCSNFDNDLHCRDRAVGGTSPTREFVGSSGESLIDLDLMEV